MKWPPTGFSAVVGVGAVAGLAGTCVMMAMRSFDERYAPATVPKTSEDPGAYAVRVVERATATEGVTPELVEKSASLATHLGYGLLFGILYAIWTGGRQRRSALADGTLLGTIVYGVGYLGWLPAVGLGKPAWKQTFPQIAGELLRHAAYGTATAATFAAIAERYLDEIKITE